MALSHNHKRTLILTFDLLRHLLHQMVMRKNMAINSERKASPMILINNCLKLFTLYKVLMGQHQKNAIVF
ncbi:hypothetical protein RHMOL_Rhmol13G0218000 [Rhododendron molle]|uniref:Uncharacterized protein n=1 Tax=Rhododendron molle TaxID=49168 RepID=A0ACC0LA41_RHOML|nr:hypothetical protein RHMOL_Rhmol13G0218000 [Rhododendron molle]